MTQHVAHRASDEIATLRAQRDELAAACIRAREVVAEHVRELLNSFAVFRDGKPIRESLEAHELAEVEGLESIVAALDAAIARATEGT